MTEIIIKVLLRLSVWFVLPDFVHNKRKYKKNKPQYIDDCVSWCKFGEMVIGF